MRGTVKSFAAGILTIFSTACGPSVDLSSKLQVELLSTGWLDAGIVAGENKLAPAVSIKLRNLSDQKLPMLRVNALFQREEDQQELGNGFITAAGSEGLASGDESQSLLISSDHGYTGTDSPADMLHNSHFVDARVDLFAKYGSAQWTKLGAFPIARQLIGR